MTITTVTAKIFRYDPSTDQEPRYETYTTPYEKDMRVLDVLDRISENQHLSLAYRWFCGIKKCGACGLVVNGKPMLSCWEPAEETMTIDPLTNFPIIRDLVVDTEGYDKVVLTLHPTITRRKGMGKFPEVISHDVMEPAYRLMSCLECYVCSAATPAKGLSNDGVDWSSSPGAAALVLFAKAALDPRDNMDRKALAKAAGLEDMPLYSQLKDICPNAIDILNDAIVPIKKKFWDKANETMQIDDTTPVFVKSGTWSAFVKLPDVMKKKLIANATLKHVKFKEIAEAYIYSKPRSVLP